jgi:hypothetical protein
VRIALYIIISIFLVQISESRAKKMAHQSDDFIGHWGLTNRSTVHSIEILKITKLYVKKQLIKLQSRNVKNI